MGSVTHLNPTRPGEYRGRVDRLAEHLAAASPEHDGEYANLAIRGRLVRQILDEQLPVALDARPDLVSLVGGGNDLLRPGADTRQTPILRRIRGRIAVFNATLWSVAARHGAAVLDQWGAAWLQDWRMWDTDRIHLTEEGHPPLPPVPPRPRRAAVIDEAAWVRGFVAPWVGRRLRGTSSGDGRAAKRPLPLVQPREPSA